MVAHISRSTRMTVCRFASVKGSSYVSFSSNGKAGGDHSRDRGIVRGTPIAHCVLEIYAFCSARSEIDQCVPTSVSSRG